MNVNWLSPVKVRTTLIGGEHKMLVWNDLEPDEKIKVYDKGVKITSREDVHELLVSYRSGDVWAPQVEQTEALKVELEYFVDCIVNDRTPVNDGAAGLRVVKLLEAADQSLKERGKVVSPLTLSRSSISWRRTWSCRTSWCRSSGTPWPRPDSWAARSWRTSSASSRPSVTSGMRSASGAVPTRFDSR